MKLNTCYLGRVFNSPARFAELVKTTNAFVRKLKKAQKIDAIAFRGVSGAALAFPISAATKTALICVRKASDNSHCGFGLEGSHKVNIKRYIIIDDFIETGSTIKKIIKEVKRYNCYDIFDDCQCVGIVLYGSSRKRKDFNGIPIYKIKTPRTKRKT